MTYRTLASCNEAITMAQAILDTGKDGRLIRLLAAWVENARKRMDDYPSDPEFYEAHVITATNGINSTISELA